MQERKDPSFSAPLWQGSANQKPQSRQPSSRPTPQLPYRCTRPPIRDIIFGTAIVNLANSKYLGPLTQPFHSTPHHLRHNPDALPSPPTQNSRLFTHRPNQALPLNPLTFLPIFPTPSRPNPHQSRWPGPGPPLGASPSTPTRPLNSRASLPTRRQFAPLPPRLKLARTLTTRTRRRLPATATAMPIRAPTPSPPRAGLRHSSQRPLPRLRSMASRHPSRRVL